MQIFTLLVSIPVIALGSQPKPKQTLKGGAIPHSSDTSVLSLFLYPKGIFKKRIRVVLVSLIIIFGVQTGSWSQAVRVTDINPGITNPSYPAYLALIGSKIYFQANDGVNGIELWSWDGATAKLEADINPGAGSSNPKGFTEYNGKIYFSANDGTNGYELWSWDGTTARLEANIYPGSGSSYPGWKNWNSNLPVSMAVYNNKLYFSADDSVNGRELWSWNGTDANLELEIYPSSGVYPPRSSDPYPLIVYQNALFFGADRGGASGNELCSWNGSVLTQISDTLGRDNASRPRHFLVHNNILYFAATYVVNESLYSYTGTNFIRITSSSYDVTSLAVFNNKIYFFSYPSSPGPGTLKSWNGSSINLEIDFIPLYSSFSMGTSPWPIGIDLIAFDSKLYFSVEGGNYERAIWTWDGSNTVLYWTTKPYAGGTGADYFTIFNNELYFKGRGITDYGDELWKVTNCPAAGTSCNDGNPCTSNDVEDGNCNCAGTFSNSPPVAIAGGPYTVTVGQNVWLDGSGSYEPQVACGDTIASYSWDLDNNGIYGDVTGVNPTVTWTTLNSFGITGAGVYAIRLRVTDSYGSTATASANLTVGASGTCMIQFQRAIGGSSIEIGYSIKQTSDNGYIMVGSSYSNDGNVSGNHGGGDFWVVKTDASGNLQWQKALGGTQLDEANEVIQTSDGGFIVIGVISSTDGDVTGHHGNTDYWIVKLDSSGNLQWQKALGGTSSDIGRDISQTTDGGYLALGVSSSNDGDVSGNHGSSDIWLVKLNSTGNIQWQKTFGGTQGEVGLKIRQTTDGGFIFGGTSASNNGDVSGHHGTSATVDFWVVKIDSNANIIWQKSLGGTSTEFLYDIQLTSDGGYIAIGSTNSNDGDVTGYQAGTDYWVVKLDGSGNIVWQGAFGGSGSDNGKSIVQTNDGGYLAFGESNSPDDGHVTGNHGQFDYWVAKLSGTGILQWQKSLGGSSSDGGNSILQSNDGNYVMFGYSFSNNGDVSGNHGSRDFWMVKLESCPISCQTIDLNPGWNLISSYEQPDDPDMAAVFSNIANNIIIVKNNAGDTYIPSLGINTIGNWEVQQGYSLKASALSQLNMGCNAVDPQNTPISLNAGVNMIAYLRTSSMPIDTALSSILADIIIVKDFLGNVYIPSLGLNSIGDMIPGQGYKVKMANAAVLTYPSN